MTWVAKEKRFWQKNRKRAVAITDVAIRKVPETHIFGFDNSQNKFIQECHRMLLKEAQKLNEEYHTETMEVGILIDLYTWDKWMIKGTKKCEVDIKNNPYALEKLITSPKNRLMFMHNHRVLGLFREKILRHFVIMMRYT